jgi:hypothetical protein
MQRMKTDLDHLRERLKAVKTTEWEAIAERAGCAASLPRKIVYEEDRNFGTATIAPLLRYFWALDAAKKRRKVAA